MFSKESTRFRYELLIDNKNSDKLFRAFLETLESQENIDAKVFTIKEITEMIPIGTAGVSNHSTYGFSIMSMFSNQKGRDYFIFDDFQMTQLFTDSCNNPNRHNYEWKKHYLNKICRINPKYLVSPAHLIL